MANEGGGALEQNDGSKNPPKGSKPPRESSGVLGKVMGALFGILLVAGIAAFLFFNVFGVRQKYVVPELRRIPLVGNFIPYLEGDEILPTNAQVAADPDLGLRRDALLQKVKSLEDKIALMEGEATQKEDHIAELNRMVNDLQPYKDQSDAFKKTKADFDTMIAAKDPKAYENFYKQINPDIAEKIYTETVKKNALDADTKSRIAAFQTMKPKAAAGVLEEMMKTDMGLTVTILQNVGADQCAKVLAEMKPRNATAISKRLIPH